MLNSDPESINVIADFDPEGLLRSIDVDIPGPPAVVISKDPPTKTEIKTVIGPTVAGPAGRPASTRSIASGSSIARLVKRGGKVRLVVKVKSNVAKHARLRAKVLGKRGRKLGAWTKQVQTNRKVTLGVSPRERRQPECPWPLGTRFSQRPGGPLRRALGASGLGSADVFELLGLAERADERARASGARASGRRCPGATPRSWA